MNCTMLIVHVYFGGLKEVVAGPMYVNLYHLTILVLIIHVLTTKI